MEQLAGPEEARGLTRPDCSIVIPTYHGRRLLETCLASLFRHLPEGPAIACEVVVADNGPDDSTRDWLSHAYPQVRVVRLAPGQGFCRAANAGVAAARGRFVQVLNDDTELTPGWIEAGLEPFRDPTVGAVSPLVLARSQPDRVDSAGDDYGLAGWPSKRGHGQPAARWASRPVEDVMTPSGSASFYRADVLRAIGGFDPTFGSYYEDVDVGFKLRWAGYRTVFAAGCRILHDISATADHRSPRLQRMMSRNAELVFWSNLPARKLALAVGPHVALLAAQAAWRLARLRFIPFYLGKIDALRELPTLAARRRARADLARRSVRPPHFPMGLGSIEKVVDHLRRPREASERSSNAHR